MAILKLGPLVADVRGPIGATVFKRTRAGPVAQRRTGARALGSTAQNTIRAAVSRLAWEWRNLGPAGQLKWIRYAAALKIGSFANRLPGLVVPYNLFMAYNVPSVALGAIVAATPPTVVGFCPTPKLTITFYTTTLISINFSVEPLISGETRLLYATRPFPRSQQNPHTWTNFTKRFVGPLSTNQNITIPTPCVPGLHLYLRLVRHSTYALDSQPQIIRTAWSYP